jgi:acetylornithine deacetylase/succinyl-diaminopimelate desuccinylase-like protein
MSVESDVLRFLDEREEELVAFTQALVATPSVNPPGDEQAVVDVAAARLRELGIADVDIVSKDVKRPNLLAHLDGVAAGRELTLCSHLDTKPAGRVDQWRRDPWDAAIEEGELYGLGSGDMKASAAAMVYAVAAIAYVGLPIGRLTLALVADEEAGSSYGAAVLIGEPSGITEAWESIALVSRGAALFKIHVSGTQTHSSISDRLPTVNATVKAARLIDRMERELKDALTYDDHPLCELGPTVNVGVTAQAGVFYGVYPGEAEFGSDIRTLPGMTRESIIADLQRFLDAAMADDPELDATLHFEEIYYEATEIESSHPLVAAVQSASESILGSSPPLQAFPGATDAAHIQGIAGLPTIAAFGPGYLPRAHSPNETVPVEDIGKAARMYALASLRYLGDGVSR